MRLTCYAADGDHVCGALPAGAAVVLPPVIRDIWAVVAAAVIAVGELHRPRRVRRGRHEVAQPSLVRVVLVAGLQVISHAFCKSNHCGVFAAGGSKQDQLLQATAAMVDCSKVQLTTPTVSHM